MDINDFIEKYCKNCKEKCNQGIREKENFIRCIDKNIYINKNAENKTIKN